MVLRQRLMEQMESRMQVEDEELRDLIDMAILEAAEGAYLPLKERLSLRKELFDSFRRLDILQELVDDPTITEIMVNGAEHIFVERQGRVEELEKHFDSVGQLEDLIQQIVSRVNRTVNLASPIADARLEDGSRVHVVLAPVALNGPILTIRKFPEPITMERLIELKSISREAAAFLQKAVEQGLNIFISGGTGSGKNDDLKRHVRLYSTGGTHHHDRGFGRASNPPCKESCQPRNKGGEPGWFAGDFHARSDPGESPNASGPHHRWGGPGRRGAGNAAGDEYGARWLALNWTCKQRKRHALKTGDNGSDGGRVAACGGPEPDRFSARSDGPCRADAGPEPEGTGDHGGDRL